MRSPKHRAPSFVCPHCLAFSQMTWADLRSDNTLTPFSTATCHSCQKASLWKADENAVLTLLSGKEPPAPVMIDPSRVTAPLPHNDLPQECLADYKEAREIAGRSPRGAAALLRLVVQKLCVKLGQPGKNINEDIKSLVKAGLPVDAQQALDVLRVTGNNAVHPGEMDLEGNPELVAASFELINFIVDQQIAQKKRIANMFAALPDGAKAAIARRDGS